jgi:hemolysin D
LAEALSGGDDNGTSPSAFAQGKEADSPLSEMMRQVPSYVTRGLLYLIVLFVCVVLAWAWFNKIDIIVSVPSNIVPKGKLKVIQPSQDSIVREILVAVGDKVSARQPLLVLESEGVSALLSDLKAKRTELLLATREMEELAPQKAAELHDKIAAERKTLALRQKVYEATVNKLSEQLRQTRLEMKSARGRLKLSARLVKVNSALSKKGIVSERMLLETKQKHAETGALLPGLESRLRETENDKIIERREFAMNRQENENRVADLNREIANLLQTAQKDHDLARIQFEKAQTMATLNLRGVSREALQSAARGEGPVTNISRLTAPVGGIVASINVQTPGESVSRGETVVEIVPQGVELVSEMKVPNKDMGKVRLGQSIKFKFDAFPFAEYGVLTGTVESISPSAQEVEAPGEEPYYRAKSLLNQEYFRIKGKEVRILPGMTALAEIKTERKSLLSLIFEPFSKLRDPLIAEP